MLHGVGQRDSLLRTELQHPPDQVEHLLPVFAVAPLLRYEPLQRFYFSPRTPVDILKR